MLKECPGGKCPVCLTRKAKFVDHSHDSGEVRGLLCLQCNCALGHLKDCPDTLSRAIEYLDRSQANA